MTRRKGDGRCEATELKNSASWTTRVRCILPLGHTEAHREKSGLQWGGGRESGRTGRETAVTQDGPEQPNPAAANPTALPWRTKNERPLAAIEIQSYFQRKGLKNWGDVWKYLRALEAENETLKRTANAASPVDAKRIATLEAERDALKARVAELEAEIERAKDLLPGWLPELRGER
jgi:hypothetical protein